MDGCNRTNFPVILKKMLSLIKMPRWLVWTLCLAIFATRVGGAHLHLCFDGQQLPASVQIGQPGVDEARHGQQDKDVSVVADALVKNIDSTFVLPSLLVAAVLLFILSAPRGARFSRDADLQIIPSSHGHHLRPPLRGPPR